MGVPGFPKQIGDRTWQARQCRSERPNEGRCVRCVCVSAIVGKSYHRGPPVFAGLRTNATAVLHSNPPSVDRIKLPKRGKGGCTTIMISRAQTLWPTSIDASPPSPKTCLRPPQSDRVSCDEPPLEQVLHRRVLNLVILHLVNCSTAGPTPNRPAPFFGAKLWPVVHGVAQHLVGRQSELLCICASVLTS